MCLGSNLSIVSGNVILLRPKMGLVPSKHDVISMPIQQYTNTELIPMERYHPEVSIMLSYMNQKNIRWKFVLSQSGNRQNWGGGGGRGTYRTFLSNATTFRNDSDNKRSVRMKHIS